MGQSDLSAKDFAELARLMNVVRDPKGGDLLAELLNGTAASGASVTKLLFVARKYFDETGDIRSEIEAACVEYLTANNFPVLPLPPPPGEAGFHSGLEEFDD